MLRHCFICMDWIYRRRKILLVSFTLMAFGFIGSVKLSSFNLYPDSISNNTKVLNSHAKRLKQRDVPPKDKLRLIETPNQPYRKLDLLIITNSSPHDEKHRHLRQAIRSTWGNCSREQMNCMIVFSVGLTSDEALDSAVLQEARIHQDLLICNVLDKYADLTEKLFCALEWVSSLEFKFLLKTDDDVYVDLPRLMTLLEHAPRNGFYGGTVYQGSVTRDRAGKHYVSEDDYAPSYFPPFCIGLMYVLSAELPELILQRSRSIKAFGVDDAYVGVVLHNASILPTSIDEFLSTKHLWMLFSVFDLCWFQRWIGIGDKLSPRQMLGIHLTLRMPSSSGVCFYFSYLSFFLLTVIICICMIFVRKFSLCCYRTAEPRQIRIEKLRDSEVLR